MTTPDLNLDHGARLYPQANGFKGAKRKDFPENGPWTTDLGGISMQARRLIFSHLARRARPLALVRVASTAADATTPWSVEGSRGRHGSDLRGTTGATSAPASCRARRLTRPPAGQSTGERQNAGLRAAPRERHGGQSSSRRQCRFDPISKPAIPPNALPLSKSRTYARLFTSQNVNSGGPR